MKVKTIFMALGVMLIVLGLIPNSKNSVNPSQLEKEELKVAVVENKKKSTQESKKLSKIQKQYLDQITTEYKAPIELVKDVLHYVEKHSHPVFPKREDLLAIIGIESSWRPHAVSSLKTDPAVGLTQIRPQAWKKWIQNAEELAHVENQIKYAAKILNYNYRLTENKNDAIIAYNVGYGAWIEGKYTDNYLTKFILEREKFKRS